MSSFRSIATRRCTWLFTLFAALLIASAHAADSDKLVGQPAPTCKVAASPGFAHVDLATYRGQVMYLDFWASWCSACVRSFPFMNDLVARYGAQGFAVLAVTLDENLDEARAFLARHPSDVIVAADPEANCARVFGLQAMPSSYLIDANQVVREVHFGFHPGRTVQMRETIEALLPHPAGG